MIGTILTITILGYYISSCLAYGNKLSTCKVRDNGRVSMPTATEYHTTLK